MTDLSFIHPLNCPFIYFLLSEQQWLLEQQIKNMTTYFNYYYVVTALLEKPVLYPGLLIMSLDTPTLIQLVWQQKQCLSNECCQ